MGNHERDGELHIDQDGRDALFAEVLEDAVHTEPTEEEMAAAAERVWARIRAAQNVASAPRRTPATSAPTPAGVLRTQADYEALFADYQRQALPEAKRELLEARIREDVGLRQAWHEFKAGKAGAVLPFAQESAAGQRAKARFARLPKWAAMAAMLAIAAGLSWYGWNAWGPAQFGPQATVRAASQPIYAVRGATVEPLLAGASIAPGEEVRVARGGFATIALRDGSLVELRESTSFRLHSFGDDLTLQLEGGDVIVEAAKRSRGHLYVQSRDVQVAVTGTVFAVAAGIHGSRVGVVEGTVLVAQNGRRLALKPGQQYTSADALTPVSVEQQIFWSQNLEQHLALMRSLSALETDLAAMRLPSLRYSSSLAPLLPADTMIYASVPNLEDPIRQAREILSGRLRQDAALREWMASRGGKLNADALLAELQGIAGYTGEEILLVSLRGSDGKPGAPALVAELRKDGFPEYLRQRMAALAGDEKVPEVMVYPDAAALSQATAGKGIHLSVAGGRMVLSPDAEVARKIATALLSQQESFYESDFGSRVAGMYRNGAGLFFAADLAGLASHSGKQAEFTGIDDLRFLEVEQQQADGTSSLRSTFTFGADRHGLVSWLAAPGALRALEFVTPGATAVMAAMVKDPVAMLEDMMGAMADTGTGSEKLIELETKLNVRIREDLAAPLGNEVAIALDGPLVPVPGWKVVVQVNDPVRLATVIERLVEALNREATLKGKPPASLTRETVDGVEFHTLTLPGAGRWSTAHFAFAQGYLVAAPDRGLVRQAIQTQASGTSILAHETFQRLIPAYTSTGFSGVFFQQASTLASFAGEAATLAGQDAKRAKAVEALAKELKPTLVAAYAGPRAVTIASKEGLVGLGGVSMLRMGMLLGHLGERHSKPSLQ